MPPSPAQWRRVALLTASAIVLYMLVRLLPTGTNLNNLDFRVEGRGALEMCDCLHPQFIAVQGARSPVVLTNEVTADSGSPAPSAREGVPVTVTLHIATVAGKPIGPADLLVVHTRLMHLLVADPGLVDYQHVHPQPVPHKPGTWRCTFTPHRSGTYRLFADITPVVTGLGLYAATDLEVGAAPRDAVQPTVAAGDATSDAAGGASAAGVVMDDLPAPVVKEGVEFLLVPKAGRLRARQPEEFSLKMRRIGGGPVGLELVMDAYAHLVAFDPDRSGFAHLHPAPIEAGAPPDAEAPELHFQVTVPKAGPYIVWSQVQVGGHDVFARFPITVHE